MILCFIAGEFTGNLSQVDKLWSLAPAVYMWTIYTHPTVEKSPRLLLMLILVQLWSLRLTYNFSRRGGYTWPPWSGEEDYRWEYVRKFWFMKYKILRLIFHIGFICVYQHILLLALVFPALMATQVYIHIYRYRLQVKWVENKWAVHRGGGTGCAGCAFAHPIFGL